MKQELARRPALLLMVSLASGLVWFDAPWLALIPLVCLGLASAIGWRAVTVAAFFAGLGLAPHPVSKDVTTGRVEALVTVLETPELLSRSQLCEVRWANDIYQLRAPREIPLAAGDEVRIIGRQRPLSSQSAANPANRQIRGQIIADPDGVKINKTGFSLFRLGVDWRESFLGFAERYLPGHSAATLGALCFNVVDDLPDETYRNLKRTGTVHIISASGLHVLLFALGLRFALGVLPIPRGWQLALIGAVLVVYAVGAGMKPPVVRSVAMAFILGGASLLRREPDLLSALGVSAVGYLLWRPVAIFDVGFQLSVVAVAGLAMFCQFGEASAASAWIHLKGTLFDSARSSLAATLTTAPLIGYYFGTLSLLAVPANVLIVLALPAITLCAFVAHLLSPLFTSVGVGILISVVQPLIGWLLAVVNTLGSLRFSSIEVPAFSAYWTLPAYGLMLLLWRPRARPV